MELVALGVAAEIVVVVEHQDTRLRNGAPVEPGGGESADAAAHDHEVVVFLDRLSVAHEAPPFAREGVRDFKGAGVLAAQPGQCRRIARRLGGDLRRRRQPAGDGQGDAIEEIAPGDRHL